MWWYVGSMSKDVHRRVVAVRMRGHEIERDLFLGSMRDDVVDPGRLCRRRAADANPLVHSLERASGVVIKLKIGLLRRPSGPEIYVGLIPDFKVPTGHLVDTIAIDQVLREGVDERVPFRIIGRRRNYRLIPEGVIVKPRRQQLGHEADLNERLHSIGQQPVVNLVHVVEVIYRACLVGLRRKRRLRREEWRESEHSGNP